MSPPRGRPPSIEKQFRDFLAGSGAKEIPNFLVVSSQSTPNESGKNIFSELRTPGYMLALAALLLGSIFGGVALGSQFAANSIEFEVKHEVAEAMRELESRIAELEARNQPSEGG